MNAPLRAAEVDWVRPETPGQACVEDARAMKLAARLASAILHPVSVLADAAEFFPSCPDDAVRKMAAHPNFGRPLQSWLSRSLDFDALPLTPAFFDRLTERSESRLCVALVTESLSVLREAASSLAIAILHRRILPIVLKSQRAKLRSVLGEEGLRLATQEAPMLYPNLAEADRANAFQTALLSEADRELTDLVAAVGMAGLARFVECCEPDLREMFARRAPIQDQTAAAFAKIQCEQTIKLFRRRAPAWSSLID
jgi:hypothetical protein